MKKSLWTKFMVFTGRFASEPLVIHIMWFLKFWDHEFQDKSSNFFSSGDFDKNFFFDFWQRFFHFFFDRVLALPGMRSASITKFSVCLTVKMLSKIDKNIISKVARWNVSSNFCVYVSGFKILIFDNSTKYAVPAQNLLKRP